MPCMHGVKCVKHLPCLAYHSVHCKHLRKAKHNFSSTDTTLLKRVANTASVLQISLSSACKHTATLSLSTTKYSRYRSNILLQCCPVEYMVRRCPPSIGLFLSHIWQLQLVAVVQLHLVQGWNVLLRLPARSTLALPAHAHVRRRWPLGHHARTIHLGEPVPHLHMHPQPVRAAPSQHR